MWPSPCRLLSTPSCSCGGWRLDPPEHDVECRTVIWARERNEWVAANPKVEPRLPSVPECRVRALEIVDPQMLPLLDSL